MSKNFLSNFAQIVPLIFYQQLLKESILIVQNSYLLFLLRVLKFHIAYQYTLLSCISGVDLLNSSYRFCVVYELLSLEFNTRLRIKVFLKGLASATSVLELYPNANWWEREIWDMFGIYFYNHTDLRRILTDYGFEGYPLQKDFPLSGFIELYYDENKKKVTLIPVSLAQEYRLFTFSLPW